MHEGLRVVLILLTAAVLMVALAKAARLPSMLAYLAIGIAVGPHALGWLHESEQTERLAEFGVVFLMFSIGLEFSLPRLTAMRWPAGMRCPRTNVPFWLPQSSMNRSLPDWCRSACRLDTCGCATTRSLSAPRPIVFVC